MTPHFIAAVSILLPICCHIGWGMSYLRNFVEEFVTLLCAITEKMNVNTFLWSELEHKR